MNRLRLSIGRNLQMASKGLGNAAATTVHHRVPNRFLKSNNRGIIMGCFWAIQNDSQVKKTLLVTNEGKTARVKEFSEIPGPQPLPMVGNIVTILMHKDYDITRFHKVWESLFNEYGPIVKMSIPGMPEMVVTMNPADIEMFFKSTMDVPTRQVFLSLKSIRDDAPNDYFKKKTGLVSENGKEWHRLRSKVQGTLMGPKSVAAYLPQIDKTTLAYMDRIDLLQEKTGQVPDNFLEDIYLWALECLGHIAMDRKLGALEPGLRPDSVPMQMVRQLTDVLTAMNDLEMGPKTWKLYKTESYIKMETAHNAFLEIADKTIREASRSLAEAKNDPNRTLSMMETMLNTPGLSKSDVVTVILDMFFAGMDTTSHSLAFMLYHLATNPHAQKKLQEEVDTVLGDAPDLLPKHFNDMTYLSYVVKESLRIHPVAIGTGRDLQRDAVMSGYKVPAGTLALGANMLISHDEKYFQRPKEFLPERWGRDRPYGPIHPFATLPFSYGTRMCIGKRIAEQEIYTFLVRTMQKYSITFESKQKMQIKTLPFVKPVIPLAFKFHRRKKF